MNMQESKGWILSTLLKIHARDVTSISMHLYACKERKRIFTNNHCTPTLQIFTSFKFFDLLFLTVFL